MADRYASVPTVSIAEAADNLSLMMGQEPGHGTPQRQPNVPYVATVSEYAQRPEQHQLSAGTPVLSYLAPQWIGEDEALVRTAAAMGVPAEDILEQLPMVWRILRAHHTAVVQPEIKHLIMKIEAALYAVVRELAATQAELADVGQEARIAQQQEARMMVVLGGFNEDTSPQSRSYALLEAMYNCREIANIAWYAMGVDLDDSDEVRDATLLKMVRGLPTTVRHGRKWSTVTVVSFASFDVRAAFLRQYGRGGLQMCGRRIRCTPSTPLFSRKKEGVLRVVMNAVNKVEAYADSEIVPLWHSLVMMKPQPRSVRDYDDNLPAWAKVKFVRTPQGRAICELHLDQECLDLLHTEAGTGEMVDGTPETVWHWAWNKQWWGRMADIDAAEAANVAGAETVDAYAADRDAEMVDARAQQDSADRAEKYAAGAAEDAAGSRPAAAAAAAAASSMPPTASSTEGGAGMGGGGEGDGSAGPWANYVRPRHWSSFFTRPGGDYFNPFPYALVMVAHPPGTLEFDKREYAQKTGRVNQPPAPPAPEEGAEKEAAEAAVAAGAVPAGTPAAARLDPLQERRAQLEAEAARLREEAGTGGGSSASTGPAPAGTPALAAADAALSAARTGPSVMRASTGGNPAAKRHSPPRG